jgi:hypothetical protein
VSACFCDECPWTPAPLKVLAPTMNLNSGTYRWYWTVDWRGHADEKRIRKASTVPIKHTPRRAQ